MTTTFGQINDKNRHIVENSVKWDEDAIQMVENYDFDLDTSYRNHSGHTPSDIHGQKPVDHCMFCGQQIVYVAVIAGKSKFAPQTTVVPVYQQIGFDCLERVLGTTWKHYHNAMAQYKQMVKDAAQESRATRYPVKYKHYIDWITGLPAMLTENRSYNYTNYFIKDMLKILTKGTKVFSPKMEDYLKRLMTDPRYDAKKAIETNQLQRVEQSQIQKLLELIKEIDGDKIHEQYSSYGFVNSVLTYVVKNNGAKRAQLDALNNVYKRYTEIKRKRDEATKKNDVFADKTIPY